MKGYLNNLTQRTLNTGNLVEPHLPSLFERHQERIIPYEEEITLVASTAAPPRVKGEKKIVERPSLQHGPTGSESEMEDEEGASPQRWRVAKESALVVSLECVLHATESRSRAGR